MPTVSRYAFLRRHSKLQRILRHLIKFCCRWFIPTFIKGLKKNLDVNDLFDTLPEHTSGLLGDKLEDAWAKESKKRKPSFAKALLRVFGCKLMCLGVITFTNEIILK